MNVREENAARALIQGFLKDSVPEYIKDTGQEILNSGGVHKLTIRKEGDTWDVEGIVQGEDFQNYSPHLMLNPGDSQISYNCNCHEAFMGVCRHVAATALKMFADLDKDYGAPEEPQRLNTEWRQSFRSFFSSSLEPETGRHYFIFRFYPEPGRLIVALFRARQNKTGLSSVHQETSLEQILRNPEWCDQSPQLLQVARQIGHYLDYYGHRIEIPEGLVSWFFWAIRREYYMFWKDTDIPCTIVSTPLTVKLRPGLDEDGLRFDVLLQRGEKKPFSISEEDSEITFHGQMPLWVCWNQSFYPVQTSLSPSLVKQLVADHPVVPQDNISEFLDRVWARLPASELYEPDEFLKIMGPIFQPATYDPKLFLDEEGSLLTLEVQNTYETVHGEFVLPGPNPDFQTGSYVFEGHTFLVRRDQTEEAALMAQLAEMHFQPRSTRLWFMEPEEAIAFLLDSYPTLVENWRVYGEKALTRYKVRMSQPVISAKVESNEKEKWFTLDIDVEYDGQHLPLERIWKAWVRGRRYVQLKDGSYTSLPESWLEKLAHKLQALGFDPTKPPKRQFKQFEAPVLDNLLDDLPNAETDSFWNSLREKVRNFTEVEPVSTPKGLTATLRNYQLQGVSYLNFLSEYGFGGILADEMGLGKTIQTLSFIQHMVNHGHEGPNLIVVPTSVLPNWERESEKFVPHLKRLIIYGTRREGMFRKDTDSTGEWSVANVNLCAARQRRIIHDIWNALKPGGLLIYSTCTYNTEEDEDNIHYIQEELGAEALTIPVKEEWQITGPLHYDHPVYRFFPHKTRGEGFFLAALQKAEGEIEEIRVKSKGKKERGKAAPSIPQEARQFLSDETSFSLEWNDSFLRAYPKAHSDLFSLINAKPLRVLSAGICLGEAKGKDFIPSQELALSTALTPNAFPSVELEWENAIKFLKKEALVLPSGTDKGYVLVRYQGLPLGFVKNLGNRANNLYPQEWRIRTG